MGFPRRRPTLQGHAEVLHCTVRCVRIVRIVAPYSYGVRVSYSLTLDPDSIIMNRTRWVFTKCAPIKTKAELNSPIGHVGKRQSLYGAEKVCFGPGQQERWRVGMDTYFLDGNGPISGLTAQQFVSHAVRPMAYSTSR